MKRTRNNRVIKGLEAQIDIFLQNIFPTQVLLNGFYKFVVMIQLSQEFYKK